MIWSGRLADAGSSYAKRAHAWIAGRGHAHSWTFSRRAQLGGTRRVWPGHARGRGAARAAALQYRGWLMLAAAAGIALAVPVAGLAELRGAVHLPVYRVHQHRDHRDFVRHRSAG